jgi:23S rRNA (uracil1939-C5)-methyltransferase
MEDAERTPSLPQPDGTQVTQATRPERGPKLHKGQIIDLTVTNLAFGGAGIAKIGAFVVFVTGGVPGDLVKARITKTKKTYAEARAVEIITPSPDRIAARCPSFGTCGGCVWQGLDYAVQLDYKTRQVRESLEHLGGLRDFELRPIEGMADQWRYRNRADFSIGRDEERGAVVGFKMPGRWDTVLPISECHLLDPGIESARAIVEAWLRDEGVPGWDPRRSEGFARHLLVRSAQNGAELLVSLVTVPGDLPGADMLIERLRSALPQLVGFVHSVNGGMAEISSGLEGTTLWGRDYLLEKVAGVTLKVSVNAFFQTNTRQTEVLYALAAQEVTAPLPGLAVSRPVIWDLYSGVGSIGLSLARHAQALLGIEAVPEAVVDATENGRLNGIENAFFLEGDVAKVLRAVAEGALELPPEVSRPDVIVVDPPRAGLTDKAITRIGELGVPRIVYVSCNPTTMGPNVAKLQEHGYRLVRVTPVDMFPHTPHVECVGLLAKTGA